MGWCFPRPGSAVRALSVTALLSAAPPGMRVSAARALQRAYGNRRFGRMLARQTPGEVAVDTARTWLNEDASVKVQTDVLRAALREIKGEQKRRVQS